MRLMLRVQATGKSALRLCSGHPLRTMPDKDLEYIRDHGVALQVMASNTLAVSSRTFFLAACIYDKFLAATVRVASAAEKPPHDALDQGEADFFVVEAPLACFIIACKFCETFAPRLADVAAIEGAGCSVHDLYNAENFVLERLGWDIDILTGTPTPFDNLASCSDIKEGLVACASARSRGPAYMANLNVQHSTFSTSCWNSRRRAAPRGSSPRQSMP
jgi:hypothetical protein